MNFIKANVITDAEESLKNTNTNTDKPVIQNLFIEIYSLVHRPPLLLLLYTFLALPYTLDFQLKH